MFLIIQVECVILFVFLAENLKIKQPQTAYPSGFYDFNVFPEAIDYRRKTLVAFKYSALVFKIEVKLAVEGRVEFLRL